MARAALFDMDKTLIKVNSARLFTKYRRDVGLAGPAQTARVSWWLLRYWLGNLDAPAVATKALEEFRGTSELAMIQMCDQWFLDYVVAHITTTARKTVEFHRQQGDRLIIASSSTRYAALPLMKELRMDEVVCTELALDAGEFTGSVVEPICYGEGKLKLVESRLSELGVSLGDSIFYSDSITDLPLLEAVGTPVVVNPDLRLLGQARKRKWRIERW